MSEQAAGTVAAAVVNGVTDRALSMVMRKLRSRSRAAVTDEKLQRLETLVLKLRCAVEVSEKHAIGSASLLEWRDRLREAAEEGGAVVLDFQRQARDREAEDGEAASTNTPGQQQPAAAGALYFTRSALSGMAQLVRDGTRRLFSADEHMKKLDGALEKMERFSDADITQFLIALQLEVSLELVQQEAKRKAPPPPAPRSKQKRESKGDYQPSARDAFDCGTQLTSLSPWWSAVESSDRVTMWDSEHVSRKTVTSSEITQLASAEAEEAEDREREARMLAKVLDEPSLQFLEGSILETGGKDMGGFEWMAELAALLWETVERGNAVLQTLCPGPGSDVIRKTGGALDLEEDGELYSFARALELLARDGVCFVLLQQLQQMCSPDYVSYI